VLGFSIFCLPLFPFFLVKERKKERKKEKKKKRKEKRAVACLPSTLEATLSAPSSILTLTSRVVLATLLSLFLSLLFVSTANLSGAAVVVVVVVIDDDDVTAAPTLPPLAPGPAATFPPALLPGLGLLTALPSSSTSILPAFRFNVAFLDLELLWERERFSDSSEASRRPARILMLSRSDISSDLPSMMWLTSSLILTFSR
jgi:hypothetical protein